LRDGRLLHEMQDRYPGRLQAIIRDAEGLHTQLSAEAEPSHSDPIWIEISEGNDRRVVVTFSGQLVRCDNKDVMVLSDDRGGVMLVGDGFLWSRQATTGLGNALRIEAEEIPKRKARQRPYPQL
jgi:hypothetical protein